MVRFPTLNPKPETPNPLHFQGYTLNPRLAMGGIPFQVALRTLHSHSVRVQDSVFRVEGLGLRV